MFENDTFNSEYFFRIIGCVHMWLHLNVFLDLCISQVDVSFVKFVL